MFQSFAKVAGAAELLFPIVEDVVLTETGTGAAGDTTHTVDMPLNIQSGELILMFCMGNNAIGAFQVPSGWTHIFNLNSGSSNSADSATFRCFFRISDGLEGPTQVVASVGSQNGCFHTYRISNNDAAVAPDQRVTAQSVDATNYTHGSVTPAWGPDNDLVIIGYAQSRSGSIVNLSAGYGDLLEITAAGTSAQFGCAGRTARLEENAVTHSPGDTTIGGGTDRGITCVVPIKPAVA